MNACKYQSSANVRRIHVGCKLTRCVCDHFGFSCFYYQDDDVFFTETIESEYDDNIRQNFYEVEPWESDISFSDIEEDGEDEIYNEDFHTGWSD